MVKEKVHGGGLRVKANHRTRRRLTRVVSLDRTNTTRRSIEKRKILFQQYAVAKKIQDTFIDTWKRREETDKEGNESSLGRG